MPSLLSNSQNLNINERGYENQTYLMTAVERGSTRAVYFLLLANADTKLTFINQNITIEGYVCKQYKKGTSIHDLFVK